MKSACPAKEACGVDRGTSSSGWEGGCPPAPRLVACVLSRFLERVQWVEMPAVNGAYSAETSQTRLSRVNASTERCLAALKKHFKKAQE